MPEKKLAQPTQLPPAFSTIVEGDLWSLWTGDCSGWMLEAVGGHLVFEHRCGYRYQTKGFYLANVLNEWFAHRAHSC